MPFPLLRGEVTGSEVVDKMEFVLYGGRGDLFSAWTSRRGNATAEARNGGTRRIDPVRDGFC